MAGENKKIAINMVAQIVSFVINLLINFILTPYVTAKVGKSVYGFVNLAFQTTSYVTIFTAALNTMVGRYITINLSKKDYKSANTYFSSVIVANALISVVLIVPSVLGVLFLDKWLGDVPAQNLVDVQILFGFIFAAFLCSLVTQFYSVSTYAANRLDLSAKRSIENNVLKAVLLAGCFMFFSPKVWYIGFANFLCGFYVIVTNIYYTRKLTPQLKFEKALVKFSAIKELISVGIWNSVMQLSNTLINGCDMLISNWYVSAAGMTLMGFAKTVPTYVISMISLVAGSFAPQMTLVYGKGDGKEFVKQTKSAIKVCGFLCSVPILGFLVFGTEFFQLWLYSLNDGEIHTVQVLSVMILLQTVFDVYIYPLYTVNSITCKLKVPVLVSLGIGVANIVGSILLCVYTSLGVYAIQIVSSVLLTLRVFFFAPVYAAHVLGEKWYTFYEPLLRGVAASVICLVLFAGYRSLLHIDSWGKLILCVIPCGIVGYMVNYIVVLNREERISIKNKVFAVCRRMKQ